MLNQFFPVNTPTFGTYTGRLRVSGCFFHNSNLHSHDSKLQWLKTNYISKTEEGKLTIFLKYDSCSILLWL